MEARMSFNLLDVPWIRVRFTDGRLGEVSVRQALAEAHQISRIAGELPTQDAALLRLLLAILLGATRPEEERSEDEALADWTALWEPGRFDMADLDPYLDTIRPRFDLFDAEAPFFQVAGLTTGSGNRSGLTKLIAEVPDGFKYFTTRAGAELESLSLAEAARWLVHCQAFDPSGIKTGATGDDRVKGGRGYPFGIPAWAGNLGLVIAEGANLFETLAFNLPLTSTGPDDLPSWERPQNGPGIDADHPLPLGPADAFTWPSRRLRLFTDGDRVVDVQVSNGDKLGPQNLHPYEPMTAWRYSKNQSSRDQRVLMPVTHDPTRRVWQGLTPLLHRHASLDDGKRPQVVEWLATLMEAEVIPASTPIDLRVVGIEYGPQNSTIADVVDDRLAAPVAAIAHQALAQAAITAAGMARDGVVALANLAGNLDRAAGGEGRAREHTFEVGYSLLDLPYRAWIGTLQDPDRIQEYLDAWAATAMAELRRAGDALVRNAGTRAVVGRMVSALGKDGQILLDAGLAQRWFHAALHKALPLPPAADKADKEPA